MNQTRIKFDPKLIDDWVAFWNSYDLSGVPELFLDDDRVTYFSSEKTGAVKGFRALMEHHREFGFVEGGKESPNKLWLDDVDTAVFGDSAVVTAIWYFRRGGSDAVQKGPVSPVYVRVGVGFRIAHANFSNYRRYCTREVQTSRIGSYCINFITDDPEHTPRYTQMENSFDEVYATKGEYTSFHQRNTAFGRAARAKKGSYRDPSQKIARILKGTPGFSLIDYAFSGAALTPAQASHSGRGNQNSGFYSRSPLGVTRKPEGVPRLEGSPEEASMIVAKAGK